MKTKGHFIKIIWDNKNKCLTNNISLYFNININKSNANADYTFEFPKSEVVEFVAKLLRKP
ncbi:hypothetical protein YYG_01910 [Plasmodium vinckei petteri]|uniref:Uncharacterized protein n=1 Tax=Plasmodium vinckei petteri TaxID=138298 RepID=W7AM53_PLAVN|nr:hypothetical protein YYG_01910 [Plasmodium vinckei petteri]